MELHINQKTYQVDADADTPLLWVLRDDLGMTGTKYGCGLAQCGACSVLVDGNVVRACVTPVAGVVGREVTTIEAVEADTVGKRVVAAWVEHQVAQCGYCQSGQVMAATALLKHTPSPATNRSAQRWSTCAAAAPTTPSMPPCMRWPKGSRPDEHARRYPAELLRLQLGETVNLSRRRFLASTAVGALVLGFGLPMGAPRCRQQRPPP